MNGPEFAVALAEAGIGLTLFAYIYGTSIERAQQWIDGIESVPHPVRLLLELFRAYPTTIDLAESVTDAHTIARRPLGGVSGRD